VQQRLARRGVLPAEQVAQPGDTERHAVIIVGQADQLERLRVDEAAPIELLAERRVAGRTAWSSSPACFSAWSAET
jgi:hypothetical protein